ncbi:4-hydroxy-tetrahydrodipicolinate synthase [Actinopolymorpha cephalotaxi]|uniref:4-hydroxy-tetrahydrodipicolinate synthase n=1 Tax=Actinopolymorpha cephalotaxi TaxID=504797 RepID=A0A1I2X403_9ACTN|nr:dihydrodipicolinate synthase family protein [Actinopolymorpha cephalotaxi]NYH85219.1 4-hydroxy-tetrahydrodipicolinate synthase [Actinopolymorpha cephalotaxi]SFH06671.1 4-hydroxy-tetrahydrodipicolinate synthase [Actinopolymorpha cephalotaxi]
MSGIAIGGVVCVVQTPFDAQGEVDAATFVRQVEWLFDNGADGVAIGMVSEVLRLSTTERDELATLLCGAATGRGASVVSVGAESTHTAVRHALHAAAAGADAVMATPPALSRTGDAELFDYFLAIADAAQLPMIVQDASGYVGSALSIDLQARLQAELTDRVLFKPEAHPIGPKLTQLLDATGGKARILEGNGGMYLVDSFRRGAVGTMPAGDLVWALVPLWRALTTGDYDRAYRIAGPLTQLVSLQTSLDSFVAIEKHLLVRQGVFTSAAVRGPVGGGVDGRMYAEVDRLVDLLRTAVDHG